MLGEVLQSQELNPDEPAVTNEPPVMPQNPVATHQAAYQATYGRPNKQQRRHRLLLQLRHPVPPHRLASHSGSRHCGRRPEDAQDD